MSVPLERSSRQGYSPKRPSLFVLALTPLQALQAIAQRSARELSPQRRNQALDPRAIEGSRNVRILIIICGREQRPYRELGPGHAEEQALEASEHWAVRRLEQLGFQVTLQSDGVT